MNTNESTTVVSTNEEAAAGAIRNSLNRVASFATQHKESALVGATTAGLVGLAWGACAFMGKRKLAAQAEQRSRLSQAHRAMAAADAKLAMMSTLTAEIADQVPGLKKQRDTISAQLEAWNPVSNKLAQSLADGKDLTVEDMEAIVATGILN